MVQIEHEKQEEDEEVKARADIEQAKKDAIVAKADALA